MLIYINSNKFPFVDMSGLTFLYKTAAWKVAPSQLDPASVGWWMVHWMFLVGRAGLRCCVEGAAAWRAMVRPRFPHKPDVWRWLRHFVSHFPSDLQTHKQRVHMMLNFPPGLVCLCYESMGGCRCRLSARHVTPWHSLTIMAPSTLKNFSLHQSR